MSLKHCRCQHSHDVIDAIEESDKMQNARPSTHLSTLNSTHAVLRYCLPVSSIDLYTGIECRANEALVHGMILLFLHNS